MAQQQYTIKAQAGQAEQRELHGKTHTVIPLIALVEGVIQGITSPTPEFVSAGTMNRSIASWNGRPVVIDHPRLEGQLVSANLPEVLETELVGTIFNARVEDGKMKMEAWIRHDHPDASERILSTLDRVVNGQEIVELSTGFFADINPSVGVYQEEHFDAIITSIFPDHLAILSSGVGACSVADGAGTNRLNAAGAQPGDSESEMALRPSVIDRVLVALGLRSNLTHDDIHRALTSKLDQILAVDFFFIWDVTDQTVIYVTFDGLFERTYSFAGDGSLTLGEDVTEVRPETNFVPLSEHKELIMPDADKKILVGELIANEATKFTTESEEWLTSLDEDQLATLVPNEAKVEPVVEIATVEPTEPKTFEELLAAAPEETRATFEHGNRLFAERKQEHIEAIKANKSNKFTDDELGAFDIAVLEKMAAVATPSDYLGRGVPRVQEDSNAIPTPAPLFTVKTD